jgi:hypothetical protein
MTSGCRTTRLARLAEACSPPERVAIENSERIVVEALDQPRDSFAGHAIGTPWTTSQLAYFVGTAMWTYLTQPFTFTWPGFETAGLEPCQENGGHWGRLRGVWPDYLAALSTVLTVYVGADGLIRPGTAWPSRSRSFSPARAAAAGSSTPATS